MANREDLPRFIEPMLATNGPCPGGGAWAAEVKFDGIRGQIRVDRHGALTIRSRPGRDCTVEFPEIHDVVDAVARRDVILDGELVCLGPDGAPRFENVRGRLGRGRPPYECAPATLMIFDILHLDGRAVRELPYAERRALLDELALHGPAWRTPRNWVGEAEDLAATTRRMGLEGIVAKRLDAPYRPGRRNGHWVKVKHRRRDIFDVSGWRDADRGTEILLARRRADGSMQPAGAAGVGLHGDRGERLREALQTRALPPLRRAQRIRWIAPGVRVSVDFHGPVDGPVRDAVIRELHLE